MGIFGKLKNILFEDDEDEIEEMPVYTKEEVRETREEVEEIVPTVTNTNVVETVSEPPRFRNVKRDIDMNFEEDDVLDEIPRAFEEAPVAPAKEEPVQPVEQPPERKSVFLDFDEDEFERLNPRSNHNDSKATQREVVRRVDVPVSDSSVARQANSNFSSTNVREEDKNRDRYKTDISSNGTKKPFTPSPALSPVFGILGVNYTKEDIVDRKGGLKREKIKPLPKKEVKKEDEEVKEEPKRISVDSVRKKAYGDDLELPKMEEKKEPKLVGEAEDEVKRQEEIKETREERNKEVEVKKENKPSEEVYKEVEEVAHVEEKPSSIEDQIEEEKFEVERTLDDEVGTVIDEVVPEVDAEKVEKKKMRVMDDLEKTSTLKILDDIEKELNSIKPISKEAEAEENADIREHEVNMDDTLENDLFNLIDSMYEEGDEDDD